MGYSKKCNETEFWDRSVYKCVPCTKKPGHYITPNCGKDDDGGRHESPFKECERNTFNDGSSASCKRCASCSSGYILSHCTTTTDTQCQDSSLYRIGATKVPFSKPTSPHFSDFGSTAPTKNQGSSLKPTTKPTTPVHPHLQWAVPLTLFSILVVICACLINRKRKLGQHTVLGYSRRSSYLNRGFSALSTPSGVNYLEDVLSPNILSAPLQAVLDNLDVLEELVILLDPESHGVKNTKHLASHCSFPAPWITYTYSMKEIKSPLKAVLEGVTSRNPDWTVRHLAKLLRQMERNDAIAVLAKLEVNVIQV